MKMRVVMSKESCIVDPLSACPVLARRCARVCPDHSEG
jgi:hypothetical protein